MLHIKKNYHSLDALNSELGLGETDLRYLAENGHLRVSVRLFGIFSEYHLEDDQPPTPLGSHPVDGPVDLSRWDVATVFREGSIQLRQIPTTDDCVLLLDDHQVITVRRRDLVVREEERLRFVAEELPPKLEATNMPCFSKMEIDGEEVTFPPNAARALQVLYERALHDDSFHSGKLVCGEIGSAALKLGEAFKRSPHWRKLIERGSKDQYRFIPARVRELSRRATSTG